MKAMILAAGLGQRMRPLTDHLPKPLLPAGGKPLLEYHLEKLANAGVTEVIINLAWLGEKIRHHLGSGEQFGLRIRYSEEPEPLETAGALLHALPSLGDAPFLLINGDVWTDYPFADLIKHELKHPEEAHLVLVNNPGFHPQGDFSPNTRGLLVEDAKLPKFTFAGLSLIHPKLISDYPAKRTKFPLGEVLRNAITRKAVTAEVYQGYWSDVGTPERLAELDDYLRKLAG